ncbi:ParA family protein [Plantactinospora sp. CA-290183]|uniref:ParA family protein n=1 Tax=Plantactinospora sp. CA-290183 TaxID=3240006 RepID=UPI003D8BF85A
MAVICLASAKGSPGVTTAGLAFALSWSRPVVLAECDPAGGDIAAGYLRHLELDGGHGLMQFVVAELRGQAGEQFWPQLVDLEPPGAQRLLLPGIATPAQAASLDPNWHSIASFFASLEHGNPGFDVIADCGRLVAPHAPWPLLSRADLALLVVKPTLSSLLPAHAVVQTLLGAAGPASEGRTGLLVVGDGEYDDRAVSRHLDVPVIAHLPDDCRSARVLAHGGTVRTRTPLFRAAAVAEGRVIRSISGRRDRLRGPVTREAAHVDV